MLDFLLKSNVQVIKAVQQIWTTKKYSFLSRPRTSFGFLFLKKGKMSYIFDDNVIDLKFGDLIFLPKNSYYEVNFETQEGAVECYLIEFDTDLSDEEYKKPKVILNDETSLISDNFESIMNLFNEREDDFIIKSQFYLLLHNINALKQRNREDGEYVIFKTAREMLVKNDEMSVEEIARKTLMSRSSFQKKFKKYFNCTPSEFRIANKIQRAKYLLLTTDIPIKDIALSLNYYDVAYFYKIFFKYCNMTPKDYRKNKALF